MTFYKRVAAADIELKSGEVLRVEDLKIEFSIEKTKDSNPNKAEIKIANLNQETRTRIREKDALIRLFCGYEQDLGLQLIFVGNAQHIVNRWETPEIITHIEAQDGQRTLRETRLSVSYGNRISANQLINRFANEMGIPLKQDFNIEGSYNSYSFSGRAKDAIDEITRRFGYTWSVEDNEILVVPKFGNAERVAVKLTPESGLVNTPERLADQEGKLEEAIEKELEWKLTSLLNPRLFPGGLVDLESKQATGVFQIEKVRHYGDTRGDAWYTEIEVKPR